MPGYGLQAADAGTGLKPWSYAVQRLQQARGYWLSTVSEWPIRANVYEV